MCIVCMRVSKYNKRLSPPSNSFLLSSIMKEPLLLQLSDSIFCCAHNRTGHCSSIPPCGRAVLKGWKTMHQIDSQSNWGTCAACAKHQKDAKCELFLWFETAESLPLLSKKKSLPFYFTSGLLGNFKADRETANQKKRQQQVYSEIFVYSFLSLFQETCSVTIHHSVIDNTSISTSLQYMHIKH